MKGYLLQSKYYMEGENPVIVLFGKLSNSETFMAKVKTFQPYFFIDERDLDRATRLASFKHQKPGLKAINGREVVKVIFRNPSRIPDIRNYFLRNGVECFEADIRFVYRFLIDHGIRAALDIKGDYVSGFRVDREYINPELKPSYHIPKLKIVSLDIETDPLGTKLYSIAMFNEVNSKVYMLGASNIDTLNNGTIYDTETFLLRAFIEEFLEYDPDVITGWNVVNFDFTILERRCKQLNIPFKLGRDNTNPRFITDETYTMSARMEISGRQVLDGIQLLRSSFYRLEDYTLDTAARVIIGEQKKIRGPGKARQISELFRFNKQELADYNLHDAQLVYKLLEKTGSIDLAITRSLLTGMPLDRVGASVASFDFLYLIKMRERGYVAPCVAGPRGDHSVLGGYVLDSEPGFHKNVIVLDFKSLYPTIIITFNIDPTTLIINGTSEKCYIRAPNGALFKKEWGILPEILAELFPQREQAKKSGNIAMSQAIKILMNSFFGVLAASNCRFYSTDLANAITYFGQEILRKTREIVENEGYPVIYGDTDSIFIKSLTQDFNKAKVIGATLRDTINKEMNTYVKETFNCDSFLEVEFEKVYWRFFMPRVRHGVEGSKKRYAGLVDPANPELIEFVGLESVRRDWTDLAKFVQRELLVRVFSGKDVLEFLRNLVKNLESRKYDNLLVYKKTLRKNLSEYTKTTPPHVKAARKQKNLSSKLIKYVITTQGPEPVTQMENPPDYKHYIEKQVAPVADSILVFLGKSFQSVIRHEQQLNLFD